MANLGQRLKACKPSILSVILFFVDNRNVHTPLLSCQQPLLFTQLFEIPRPNLNSDNLTSEKIST